MSTAQQGRPIEFPPGVDGRALLRPMWHNGYYLMNEHGAARRRHTCRRSPLLFALTYMPHVLRQQDTGLTSFAQPHLDMAAAAERWIGPVSERDIWIGPRGLGKTRWQFCILPAWAMAYSYRKFVLALSYTADQAGVHLANLRMELDDNELLRHDFAELAPKRVRGARQTSTTVVNNGATIMVRGLGAANLGLTARENRPDLIIGDDLEPVEEDYSDEAKLKLQRKLINGVLRMGAPHAVVQLSGTVTRSGSMIHDAVREAKGEGTTASAWVQQHRFTPRYYPPILDDGSSLWPARWSVEQLRAEAAADAHDYELNMLNDPGDRMADGSSWWTQELFRYWDEFPTVRRVIHVDVATTRNRGSDFTVLAMAGGDATGQRACLERVEWGRWSLDDTRHAIASFCAGLRLLPLVRIEGNQGGDTWLDSLSPWPDGVQYEIVHARGSKSGRIAAAHNDYKARAVWHLAPDRELERMLCRWHPRTTEHDDVPDAVAGALAWVLSARRRHADS